LDLRSAGLQHLCALLEKGMSYRDKEKVGIHVERAGWLVHVLEAHSLGGTFSFPFLVACADHLANKMHDYDQSLSLLRSLREQLSEGEIVTQLGGVTGLAGMQMTCRDDRTGKPVLESYPSRQLSAVLDHMVTEEADYPRILSIALHTGEVLMKREEFHEAQHQFDQFLGLFTDLGCQRDGVFARATCLVGDCLRAQGRYAEALNRYEEALHTCTQFTRATGDLE
jgi:tetratricopeptide (TPR) repeat protein